MSVYGQKVIPRDGFDSTLEARHAEFLYLHNIKGIYHPIKIDYGNGQIYSPDYWLSELRMWAEIKWNPSASDREKLRQICDKTGTPGILLLQDGMFEMYDPKTGWHPSDEIQFCYCRKCGTYHWRIVGQSKACPVCGYDAGDQTSIVMGYGNGERGKIVPKTYFSRCAYKKDRGLPHHQALYRPGDPTSIKEVEERERR